MTGPRRPRAILFDWDDTLVDNWESIYAAMNATLAAMGKSPWTIGQTKFEARRSLRNSFPELFGDRWEEARGVFYRHFAENHLQFLKPHRGAEDAILRLKKSGLYLAVISNKTGDYLRREAAHLGWAEHFGAIVGATDAPADKPAPAPALQALAKSGVSAGPDVWLVGDGMSDMECAHRAHCVAVLLREMPPKPGEFGSYPPFCHVRGFAELEALVLDSEG